MGAGHYTSGLRRRRVMTSAPEPPEPPTWAADAGSGIANVRPVIEPMITNTGSAAIIGFRAPDGQTGYLN